MCSELVVITRPDIKNNRVCEHPWKGDLDEQISIGVNLKSYHLGELCVSLRDSGEQWLDVKYTAPLPYRPWRLFPGSTVGR